MSSTSKYILSSPSSDAKAGWILPLAFLVYAVLHTVAGYEDNSVAWTATLSSAAAMTCVLAVSYKFISFVTIAAGGFILTYSVPAMLNLLLDQPVIASNWWISTDLAMLGATVACLSITGGVALFRLTRATREAILVPSTDLITSRGANIALVSLYFPVTAFMMATGVYYSRLLDASTQQAMLDEGSRYTHIFSLSLYVAQSGIYLQLYRYMNTRNRLDLWLTILLSAIPMILMAPTGWRGLAVTHFLFMLLLYSTLETSKKKKLFLVAAIAISISVFSAVIGTYRSLELAEGLSVGERWSLIVDHAISPNNSGNNSASAVGTMASRLGTYIGTGEIIRYTPDSVPYRGSEGLEDLWMIAVPKSLFPDRPVFNHSPELSARYGIGSQLAGEGSAPPTLVGDLYSRWGWMGVILGMLSFGFVLCTLDSVFFKKWDTQTIVFYSVFMQRALGAIQQDVFTLFILFGRELLVAWLISRALGRILVKHFSSELGVVSASGIAARITRNEGSGMRGGPAHVRSR